MIEVKCIECGKLHKLENWYEIEKEENHSICEIHVMCACYKGITVEHIHNQYENCYNGEVTEVLGGEVKQQKYQSQTIGNNSIGINDISYYNI